MASMDLWTTAVRRWGTKRIYWLVRLDKNLRGLTHVAGACCEIIESRARGHAQPKFLRDCNTDAGV